MVILRKRGDPVDTDNTRERGIGFDVSLKGIRVRARWIKAWILKCVYTE